MSVYETATSDNIALPSSRLAQSETGEKAGETGLDTDLLAEASRLQYRKGRPLESSPPTPTFLLARARKNGSEKRRRTASLMSAAKYDNSV